MGVDQITHVFVGRLCSESEKQRCFEKFKDVNEEQMCDIFNVEDACYFESDDGYPIVPFTYGWGYDRNVLTFPIEDFSWFVVAHYITTVRSETEESFIDLEYLSQLNYRERKGYKLIVLRDIS